MEPNGPHIATTLAGSPPDSLEGPPSLAAGTEIDQFRVIRPLGRGGMGEVYLARDTQLGRKVALKLIRPDRLGSPDAVERFLKEARTTARFSHPHIVQIYAVGFHQDTPFVALEFLDGDNLRQRVGPQAMSPLEVLRIAHPIAEALAEAHAHSILHRDLKPENIVIPRDGRVRVVDFGLAGTFLADFPEAAAAGARQDTTLPAGLAVGEGVQGTPGYMAPEQWSQRSCTGATDVWALGVILYELSTGLRPFPANDLFHQALDVCGPEEAVRADSHCELPPDLADLIADCLRKDPEARPAATEVAERIQAMRQSADRRGTDENPFRGLLPFTRRQAGLFFGREAEVDIFLERLRLEPLLPIVGPSGGGKSSFVQAGVIPRLLEQARWHVLQVRPGGNPFHALASRLHRAETQDSSLSSPLNRKEQPTPDPSVVQALAKQLTETPGRLNLELQRLTAELGGPVLLYIDQLEELFTLCEDPTVHRAFLESLTLAADDPAEPVRVILTVRDDFLGRLAVGPRVQEAFSRVTVIQRPGPEALREILTRPIALRGFAYDDPALVDEMIKAVGQEPACLPLLQFVGRQLWERRDVSGGKLLRSTYMALGGVSGALAKHADGVLAGLSSSGHRLARAILLRLVTPDRTRRVLAQGHVIAGLSEQASGVLDRLIAARLISVQRTTSKEDADALLELAHESLVQTWSTLSRWIDESRDEITWMADLHEGALRWQKHGHRKEDLWTGDTLAEAQRCIRRADTPPSVPAAAFLAASHAQSARRQRRRRALLATGALALVLITAGALLASVAIKQNEQLAQDQRARAETKEQEAQVERVRALAKEREAHLQRERAEVEQAVALQEGARAALSQGDMLEARSKLRRAMEGKGSRLPATARALWRELGLTTTRWVWRRSGTSVYKVDVSPDGSQIAATGQQPVIQLFDIETRANQTLRGHSEQVYALSYSPDGSALVSGGWDGELRLWDPRSATARSVLNDTLGPIWATQFNSTGELIAVGHGPDGLAFVNPDSGIVIQRLVGHEGAVKSLAFNPAGTLLASGAKDQTVRLWDTSSGVELRRLEKHRDRVLALAFTPDGEQLATGGSDGLIQLWNARTGAELVTFNQPNRHYIYFSVDFSPDGALLAAASMSHGIQLWDMRTKAPLPTVPNTTGIGSLRFGPEGHLLVSSGWDESVHGNVRVTRLDHTDDQPGHPPRPGDPQDDPIENPHQPTPSTGLAERQPTVSGHQAQVCGVAVSADSKRIASSSNAGAVILWNAETGQPVHRYRALEGAARSLSFHPNGQQLAAGLNSIVSGYSLHVWDLRTHRTVQRSHAHTGPIQVVRYSEDGSRILTAGGHDVRLWETNSWQLIQRFDLGERRVHSADLSPDGQTVMASTDRGDVTAWTVGTGVPIHTGVHHTNNIYGARFAVGGTDIITGGTDRTLRRLDLESGVATKLAEFPGRIYWLDRHPDGVHVGIPTSDGRAFLWNLNTGTQRPLIGHTHEVNELAFSRDGTFAVTASDDRTVRVWDVETGQPRWRGPALLRSPPTLVSHRGWQTLPSPAARAPDAAWARALIERARFASDSGEGDTLCVQTRGGFELWDRRTDSLRASQDGAIDGVMALGRGCVAWTDQQIWLYDAEGHARRLTTEGPVSAVGSTGDTLLVAVQEGLTSQVLSVDTATLTTETRWTVKVNVTAITESHGVGVIGYDDGGVEVLSPDGDTVALVLSATDSTDIVALLEGPQETVIVGFSGGQIGLWSQADGTKLAVGHLHGRVVHTFIQDQFLYAATDLGEYLTWDLSAFYLSRCELLREIWARVPTVWRGGRPVAEPPPAGHECLATN